MEHVSCFIPTLNEEDTIEKTLQTLEDQTHTIEKVFIIDGGSTDATHDRIEAMQDAVSYAIDLTVIDGGGVRYSSQIGGEKAARHLLDEQEYENAIILRAEADSGLHERFLEEAVSALNNNHVSLYGARSVPAKPQERKALKGLLTAFSNADNLPKGRGMAFTAQDFRQADGYRLETEPSTEQMDPSLDCFGDVVITHKLRKRGNVVFSSDAHVTTQIPSTSMSSPDRIKKRVRLERRIGPTPHLWQKMNPFAVASSMSHQLPDRPKAPTDQIRNHFSIDRPIEPPRDFLAKINPVNVANQIRYRLQRGEQVEA